MVIISILVLPACMLKKFPPPVLDDSLLLAADDRQLFIKLIRCTRFQLNALVSFGQAGQEVPFDSIISTSYIMICRTEKRGKDLAVPP